MKDELISNFAKNYEDLFSKYTMAYRNLRISIAESFEKSPDEIASIFEIIVENGSEECHRALISPKILEKIISLIEVDKSAADLEKNEKWYKLYFSIEQCGTDSTRLMFISKNLEMLQTVTNNSPQPFQKRALENLKNVRTPGTLGDTQQLFYSTLNNLITNFGNPQDKLDCVMIIFKFFNLLGDETKQNFVSNPIRHYITSTDPEWLNSLLDTLEGDESSVENEYEEKIWLDVTQRSYAFIDQGTQPEGKRLFIRILKQYEANDEPTKEFIDKFATQNLPVLLNFLKENKNELKKDSVNIIYKILLQKSTALDHEQQRLVFDLLVELKEKASQEYIDMLSDRLYELTKTQNIDIQNIGIEYMDQVRKDVSSDKREYLSTQLVKSLLQVSPSVDFNITTNIINTLLKFRDDLTSESRTGLIDFLMPLTKESGINPDIRKRCFEYLSLPKIGRLPRNRINQVLKHLLHILKTEEQFYEPCLKSLKSFKERYKGPKGFWNEVKKIEESHN